MIQDYRMSNCLLDGAFIHFQKRVYKSLMLPSPARAWFAHFTLKCSRRSTLFPVFLVSTSHIYYFKTIEEDPRCFSLTLK